MCVVFVWPLNDKNEVGFVWVFFFFFGGGRVEFSFLIVVQWLSLQHARLTCPSLSPSLLKLMSIESVMVMPSNHLILCHPLLLNLSQHQGLFQ